MINGTIKILIFSSKLSLGFNILQIVSLLIFRYESGSEVIKGLVWLYQKGKEIFLYPSDYHYFYRRDQIPGARKKDGIRRIIP
jgi:hypothetical protein